MTEVEKLLKIINSPPEEGGRTKQELREALRLLKSLCLSKSNLDISCEGRIRCFHCTKTFKKNPSQITFRCDCNMVYHSECLKTMIFKNFLQDNELQIECPGCHKLMKSNDLKQMLGQKQFENLEDKINGQIFQCQICLENKKVEESCITLTCEHRVCQECLKHSIESNIDENKWPIKCVMQNCQEAIDFNIVKSLVSPIHFEKYDTGILQKIAMSSHGNNFNHEVAIKCPNASCKLIFLIDKTEKYTHHTCERCKMRFCVNGCPRAHEGSSCEKFRQWLIDNDEGDKKFEVLMKKEGWVKCPKCNIPVERIADCPHMKCGICKTQFCYACKDKPTVWGTCMHSK